MIVIALIIAIAMAASFWAGTKYPLRPSEQNEAWDQEGYAAAASGMSPNECPYRDENMTARTFWFSGYCARRNRRTI